MTPEAQQAITRIKDAPVHEAHHDWMIVRAEDMRALLATLDEASENIQTLKSMYKIEVQKSLQAEGRMHKAEGNMARLQQERNEVIRQRDDATGLTHLRRLQGEAQIP